MSEYPQLLMSEPFLFNVAKKAIKIYVQNAPPYMVMDGHDVRA